MGTVATWNPSDKGTAVTLSGGDLSTSVTAASFGVVRSTISKTTGKWYWEVQITDTSTANALIGVANATQGLNPSSAATNLGGNTNSLVITNTRLIRYNNAIVATMTGANFVQNDIISIAYDADAGTVTFRRNNADATTISSPNVPSGALFAAVGGAGNGGTAFTSTTNFGASAFTYTPPASHLALATFLDFSISTDAGMTMNGTAADITFEPLEIVMSGGMSVGGAFVSAYEYAPITMDSRMTVGGAFAIVFPQPLDYTHDMFGKMSVGASIPYDGPELASIGLSAGMANNIFFYPEDAPGYVYGTVTGEAPVATAVVTALQGNKGTVTAAASMATANIAGQSFSIAATAPMATAVVTALLGHKAVVTGTAPRATASLLGVNTFSAIITARAPKATATLTAIGSNSGSITARAPKARAVLTSYITITGTVTASAPMASADLSGGSGIVTSLVFTAPMARARLASNQSITTLVNEVVANTVTGAVTEYDNYGFDSFAVIGGTTYAAGADGIYELDSSTTDQSAAINASFSTGAIDFSSEYLKRMESVYAACRVNGDFRVSVKTDEGQKYTYNMKYDQVPTIKQRRIPVGKGLKGKYFQFEFANVGGASFSFDTLNILVHETVRRIGA